MCGSMNSTAGQSDSILSAWAISQICPEVKSWIFAADATWEACINPAGQTALDTNLVKIFGVRLKHS